MYRMIADNRVLVQKTRTKTRCPVFGMLKELSENELPTYESVMRYYMLIKHQLKLKNHN